MLILYELVCEFWRCNCVRRLNVGLFSNSCLRAVQQVWLSGKVPVLQMASPALQEGYLHTCNCARCLECLISCDTLSRCPQARDYVLEQFTRQQSFMVMVMVMISKNCGQQDQSDLGIGNWRLHTQLHSDHWGKTNPRLTFKLCYRLPRFKDLLSCILSHIVSLVTEFALVLFCKDLICYCLS